MNKVIMIGNLVADPEMRRTQSDIPVCTFRIAVQRRFADQSGVRLADFFNVVAWRQTAELCHKYLAKGRKCGIVGTLQNRSYDAQDGTKRYVTEIIADEVEFLTPRTDGQENAYSGNQTPEPSPSNYGNNEFVPVDDDEIPF